MKQTSQNFQSSIRFVNQIIPCIYQNTISDDKNNQKKHTRLNTFQDDLKYSTISISTGKKM